MGELTMSSIVRNDVGNSQSAPADHSKGEQSASADLSRWRELLRQAMADTEWNCEALDAHWKTSRGYASSLVNGDRCEKWSLLRVLALPADVRARLAYLEAKEHGLIVVAPLHGSEAIDALVAGLVGMVASAVLPARATAMAKASLPYGERRRA